jgi:hypothetical protein
MTAQQPHHKPNARTRNRARGKGLLERGTTTAEEIHRAVAGFPLDLLEMVPALEKPVARVRKLQDKSIAATYTMVRGINKELELLAGRTTAKPKKRPARTQAEHHAQAVRAVAEAS